MPCTVRVCHFVYDLIRGGTEGQCARTAMALQRSAGKGEIHRVAVFFRRGGMLEATERTCGPVKEIPIRHFLRRETLSAVQAFARWLKGEKIGILHAWDADAAIFGQFAAELAGCRFVASRRDLGEIYPFHKRLLLARADRKARKIVVNAKSIDERFRKTGKTVLIGNLFDFDSFRAEAEKPFPREKELPGGKRTAVVARLDPEKNVKLLVKALALMDGGASLVVAGDGAERSALEKHVAELGLQGRVAFLGDIAEIPALLARCDAAALVPKANEGQSNAVMEYLASGLPVLATDCGGNRELLEAAGPGAGGLIPPAATPEEAAAAWRKVLSLPRRPAAPLPGHSPKEVAGAFRALYESILPRG
jgi:glycosyltransferase involved in cell wall biosynthesis